MKYGIISDIHGNYAAFKKIINFLNREKVDSIINCGDLVGYGPLPDDCIRAVKRNSNIISVRGNHDYVLLGMSNCSMFNRAAAESLKWTKENISLESMNFLYNLKDILVESGFLFVHGSPRRTLDEYIMSESDAQTNFEKFRNFICFVGHTHIPGFFCRYPEGNVVYCRLSPGIAVKLKKNCRYIINPGSVGQPRDGDNRASCLIFNSETSLMELYRISYEIREVQDLMRKKKLPDSLIERLASGL